MANRIATRLPLPLLALGALGVVVLIVASRGRDGIGAAPDPTGDCRGLPPEVCGPGASAESPDVSRTMPSPEHEDTVLTMEQACVDVGYLCAGVKQEGSLRILRWPEETESIRILVPLPGGTEPDTARAFQRAAVRGIQTWHGHPIPLSVRTRSSGEGEDFQVEWSRTVEDGRLGKAEVEWRSRGGRVQLEIRGFAIATHDPVNPGRRLTPDEVALVAAHEMGHVLGLPHSDDPRDVMFPTNTATRLTVRDFRTVEALYALPNGVEIRR